MGRVRQYKLAATVKVTRFKYYHMVKAWKRQHANIVYSKNKSHRYQVSHLYLEIGNFLGKPQSRIHNLMKK